MDTYYIHAHRHPAFPQSGGPPRSPVPPFPELPRAYTPLCPLPLPRPLRTKAEYEHTRAFAEAFAGFESQMTPDQTDYFELLCPLMENWEAARTKWPAVTPLE